MIRAIIVEDDLMVASINKQYLSLIPEIRVSATFYDGSDAWAYLESNAVDLMILDVYLPGMTGLELLAKARAAKLKVDIIMVTAANDPQSLDTAMRLGALDYLVKPFSFERFKAAITKYLYRRQALQQEGQLSQPAIDKLLGAEPAGEKAHLTKGLQDKTLSMLRELLRAQGDALLTSEELATASGLSRVTVRRYMNYLIDAGEVVSEVDYRTGGRPSMQYRTIREDVPEGTSPAT